MIGTILGWLAKGPLDRILDTVDAKFAHETDRTKIKADLIAEHYKHRSEWMRAGGFILMMLFAVPLAAWFSAVIFYSIFWCAGCAYPMDWTVAALPPPLDEWGGMIVVSIFGVIGVSRLRR